MPAAGHPSPDGATLGTMRNAPAGRLLTRLLVGTLVPTILALGTFGILAHEVARSVLEDELGRRLALAAAGTAGMVLPEQVVALGDGDTSSLTYANVRRKLDIARERFDVRRVALVSRQLIALADSEGRIAIGAEAHELGADRLELARAKSGHPAASPLFIGHDRLPYKRGYAAIGDPAGTNSTPRIVGFAVVEASADYFVPLGAFRRQLILGGCAALAIVMIVTVVMARRISGPVVRLASVAERIGRGDLDHPVPVATRDEVGFLAQTLDNMRAALKTRDERLQMMLAGIAHEVRNPLGGLELYAGLLRDALSDRPERLEEVSRIEREVQYLKRVVTEFLDYARRAPPEISTVGVLSLFTEIQELASAPDVTIDIDAARGLSVSADAGQLRRALLNLTRNAVAAATRAHPDGIGHVRMAARATGGGVRIEIDDDGAGVDPALREKIFTPFFTTREKGTGLGLAFVREIVMDHGGEIHVGDAPGGGARFWFELATP